MPSPPTSTKKRRRSLDSSDDTTDTKLALLLSLHPTTPLPTLLETLLASNGCVSSASSSLSLSQRPRKQQRQQSTLSSFIYTPTVPKPLRPPKKGETIHLYTPSSVSTAPCPTELRHSFLPAALATSLLQELLKESESFPPPTNFRLFERDVTSPHTSGFFLRDPNAADNYHSYQSRPMQARPYTPSMLAATAMVEDAVNAAITTRLKGGKKPWGLSPERWNTNAALANRYSGARQAVGWHTDEATYLGPMAVIAGLSLGVEREFRVRRVVKEEEDGEAGEGEGAYAIHLPHNSLLIMHAGMQEGWKHCVHPAKTVDLHPVSRDVRISITYRCYRRSLRPGLTPRCKCNIPTTLRPVFGPDPPDPDTPRRYFWGCAAPYRTESEGKTCGFFRWAEFDSDGEPVGQRWSVKSEGG